MERSDDNVPNGEISVMITLDREAENAIVWNGNGRAHSKLQQVTLRELFKVHCPYKHRFLDIKVLNRMVCTI